MSDEIDKALSPQEQEKRLYPRIDAKVEVNFKSGEEFVQCYSRNISQGGMFLEAEALPDPNANIELLLKLPDQDGHRLEVVLSARVVRLMTVSESGKEIHKIAVQFLNVSPQIQLKLDQLYSQLSGED